MIPILRSAPLFGFTGLLPGPIGHLALSNTVTFEAAAVVSEMTLMGSADGTAFQERRLRGDATLYTRSDKGGAFAPHTGLVFNELLVVGGRMITKPGSALVENPAIMTAPVDKPTVWTLRDTDIPTISSGDQTIIALAANAGQIAGLTRGGRVTVSADGASWAEGTGIAFTGSSPARCLAASDWGFVAGGRDGQLFTAPDPTGAWTARSNGFGGSDDIRVARAAQVFIIAGESGKIATAPLTSPTTWTMRTSGVAATLGFMVTDGARSFIGGNGIWLTSTDGTSWSTPADNPFKGGGFDAYSAYKANGSWYVHWNTDLSRSDDGTTWTKLTDTGLPEAAHIVSAHLGS